VTAVQIHGITSRDAGKIFYDGSEAYTPEVRERPRLNHGKATKHMVTIITGGWVRSPEHDAHAESSATD